MDQRVSAVLHDDLDLATTRAMCFPDESAGLKTPKTRRCATAHAAQAARTPVQEDQSPISAVA